MKEVFGREDYVEFCKNENKKVLKPGESLVQYVRTKKNKQPCGVVIAYKGDDNKFYVGYSLCNTKVDKYDRQIGLRKAVERAVNEETFQPEWMKTVPHSVLKTLVRMIKRAEQFFKD